MFKVGDTVLYGSDGVCKITEITEKLFGGTAIEYYILSPIFSRGSKVFVPSKNKKLVDKMHYVLSFEEIKSIINDKDNESTWIDDDSQREESYKNTMATGDFGKITSVIKGIVTHRDELFKNGKKLHKADEYILKEAIKIVYEELALAVKVSKDDIIDIICNKISLDTLIKNV